MSLMKRCIAELVGTAVLCFAACGVAVFANAMGWWVATALAFGLVIVAMAYSIGNVSGCHINPAVSFAMFLSKKMTALEFGAYVGAQFVGALVGSTLLGLCHRGNFASLGGNEIQAALKTEATLFAAGSLDGWSYIGAFLAEVLLTFIFVMAILGVTDAKHHDGKHAGIVIGLTLTLVHLLGLGITGTSVNPARSFAPALLQAFAGNTTSLAQIWIWLLAPMAGAAAAAYAYKYLTESNEAPVAEEAPAAEEKTEE